MLRISLVLLVMAAAALPVIGQDYGRPDAPSIGLQLSRDTLEKLLSSYEATAESPIYSRQLKDRARREAQLIRERLQTGDIQVGDKVFLVVERQPDLSDTFAVVSGRRIVLPEIGAVPLEGVLRSELQQYMLQYLSKYIVNPTVHANSLVRLELSGNIGRAGFYDVPSDMQLSDVLMLAGGPGGNAALDHLSVRRANDRIWDGDALRTAMVEGSTVDQLSLRAGDVIEVPPKRSTWQIVRSLWPVFPAIWMVIRIKNNL